MQSNPRRALHSGIIHTAGTVELGYAVYAVDGTHVGATLSQKVAIKITQKSRAGMAKREAELLAALSGSGSTTDAPKGGGEGGGGGAHPNVIKLLNCYTHKKKLYSVFEFCAGGDLMDWVFNTDRLEEAAAQLVARDLMAAVDFIHSKQVAHRDIKGENILCTGDFRKGTLVCKLADFGAATSFCTGQLFSQRIGSTSYIAPEVRSLPRILHPKYAVFSIRRSARAESSLGFSTYIFVVFVFVFNSFKEEEGRRGIDSCYRVSESPAQENRRHHLMLIRVQFHTMTLFIHPKQTNKQRQRMIPGGKAKVLPCSGRHLVCGCHHLCFAGRISAIPCAVS